MRRPTETIFRFDPLRAIRAARWRPSSGACRETAPRCPTAAGSRRARIRSNPSCSTRTGASIVNIGAPTDGCLPAPAIKPCAAGEGASPLASIWAFTPPPGGDISDAEAGRSRLPATRCLRADCATRWRLPCIRNFPPTGSRSCKARTAAICPTCIKPNEELNAIEKGKHYGWPYCYDLSTDKSRVQGLPAGEDVVQGPVRQRGAVSTAVLAVAAARARRSPCCTIPAPNSPSCRAGWWSACTATGRPAAASCSTTSTTKAFQKSVRRRCATTSAVRRSRAATFQTEAQPQVAAAPFTELVSEWHKVNGVRPQGAPVGMTVASDGAIWLVEDKNQTVIRIDRGAGAAAGAAAVRRAQSQAQIDELAKFVETDASEQPAADRDPDRTRRETLPRLPCGFRIEGRADRQAKRTIPCCVSCCRRMAGFIPAIPSAGRLHTRLNGIGAEKLMPPGGEEPARPRARLHAAAGVARSFSSATMVPGTRMRIKGGRVDRKFVNRAGQ